jgi:hypothetical protein
MKALFESFMQILPRVNPNRQKPVLDNHDGNIENWHELKYKIA